MEKTKRSPAKLTRGPEKMPVGPPFACGQIAVKNRLPTMFDSQLCYGGDRRVRSFSHVATAKLSIGKIKEKLPIERSH
jgi:hypothetical protein